MLRPAAFEYEAPTRLDEALELLEARENAVALAGGQSLMPAINARAVRPDLVVDIMRIASMHGLRVANGRLQLGALTVHRVLVTDPRVRHAAPLLAQAASLIGDPTVRRRGTLGGSLAHNGFGAELPVACLALGAAIDVHSVTGDRVTPAVRFFDGGHTVLAPASLVTAIDVPVAGPAEGSAVREYSGQRHGVNVVAAARVWRTPAGRCGDVRLALGGAHAPVSLDKLAAEHLIGVLVDDVRSVEAAVVRLSRAVEAELLPFRTRHEDLSGAAAGRSIAAACGDVARRRLGKLHGH